MRILFPTTEFPPLVGGVSTLAFEQAKGLAELGEEVSVETVEFPEGEKLSFPKGLDVRYAKVRARSIVRVLPLAWNLWRRARSFRPDFLYSPTYRGFGPPVELVGRQLGVRYGIYLHGTEINTEVRSRARRVLLQSTLHKAAVLFCNSRSTRDFLLSVFPELRCPVKVIPPAVEYERFQGKDVEARAKQLRSQWLEVLNGTQRGSSKEAVVLLSFCRMSMQKGIDYVLRALRLILSRDPDFPAVYVVAGGGPDLSHFKSLSAELGLEQRVLFLGRVDQELVEATYRAADVYVQPSQPASGFIEGFGISFLEAQSSGLACIGADWGGVPEAVSKGKSAILVPVQDLAEVAGAVERLVRDEVLRGEMSANARAHAQTFSWGAHAATLRNEIAAVAGS